MKNGYDFSAWLVNSLCEKETGALILEHFQLVCSQLYALLVVFYSGLESVMLYCKNGFSLSLPLCSHPQWEERVKRLMFVMADDERLDSEVYTTHTAYLEKQSGFDCH